MKSMEFKKVAAILLSIGIIASVSACGKSDNKDANTASTTQASTQSTTTIDPMAKYSPEITLTAVKSFNSSFKYPAGMDISNNMWTREIKDKLGINVKYNWTADESQYVSKLNISIASGDIPDFFMCKPDQFMNMANAGQLADITDVYNKYASKDLKETDDAFPDGFNSGKIDNKLKGLSLQGFGTFGSHQYLWIRDDWMKKYNLSAPKTMDDVVKIAETFASNKPDGQAVTFGISVSKSLYSGTHSLAGFANGHHAYPGTWIKDASGNITYGSIQPEMQTALAAFQSWFKKGLINKEFGAIDSNKADQDFINGKVGIMAGASWVDMSAPATLIKNNPNAVVKPYEIPSSDGKPVMYTAGWPVSDYYVVNKNCKNPEAVIKMANFYQNINQHATIEEYRKFMVAESADEYYKMGPIYTFDPRSSENEYKYISAGLAAKDASKVPPACLSKYNLALKWLTSKDLAGYGAYFQVSNEGAFSIGKKVSDEKRVILSPLHGATPPKYAQVKATLDKLELETFTKIILGEADPNTEFPKFVDSWKKLGGDDAVKEMNDTYNKK